MRNVARLITEEFDKVEVKYGLMDDDEKTVVEAGFPIENGPNVLVKFICRGDDGDNNVAIRLFQLAKVTEDQLDKAIKVVNECNNEFRFVKFCVDSDRDINVETDIPTRSSDDCVGQMAVEYFIRIMSIVKEAYPTIMRALWS